MILEIASFSIEAAEIAASHGADRIEFCHNYEEGGVSPPLTEVKELTTKIHNPVFVMIRPRPGNFTYSSSELSVMKANIIAMKQVGADGFVFGILNSENELDIKNCSDLVNTAMPLPCTLHRAFDDTPDNIKTLQAAVDCGFARILSSGGKGSVVENIKTLELLIRKASDQIIIMPGGGLRSNSMDLLKEAGAREFHSSCITGRQTLLPDSEEIKLLKNKLLS